MKYFKRKSFEVRKCHPRLIPISNLEEEWVINDRTLHQQCAMNLAERAAEFNKKFQTDKATAYIIRNIYRKHKIKKKNIKVTKIMTYKQKENQKNQITQLKVDIPDVQLAGYKFVCVDEMMCSIGTIPKVCWSNKNQPMKIDRNLYNKETIACCAAISQEGGVEHVSYFKRALDRYDFVKFLDALKQVLVDDKICIFMDQLPVHKSLIVKEKIEEFGWKILFNAAYFPDGNGIEFIFGVVKQYFKKLRLAAILNGKKDYAKKQLVQSFKQPSVDVCKKAIQLSINNIMNFV